MEQRSGGFSPSFACGMCGKCFSNAEQCSLHIQSHTGQQPFRCVICWPLFYDMPSGQTPDAGSSISQPPVPLAAFTQGTATALPNGTGTSPTTATPEGNTLTKTVVPTGGANVLNSSASFVPEQVSKTSISVAAVSQNADLVAKVMGEAVGSNTQLVDTAQQGLSVAANAKETVVSINHPSASLASASAAQVPTSNVSADISSHTQKQSTSEEGISPAPVHAAVNPLHSCDDGHHEHAAGSSASKDLPQCVGAMSPASVLVGATASDVETPSTSLGSSPVREEINPVPQYTVDLTACVDSVKQQLPGGVVTESRHQDSSPDQKQQSSFDSNNSEVGTEAQTSTSVCEQSSSSGSRESLAYRGRRKKGKPKRLAGDLPISPHVAVRFCNNAIFSDHMYSNLSRKQMAGVSSQHNSDSTSAAEVVQLELETVQLNTDSENKLTVQEEQEENDHPEEIHIEGVSTHKTVSPEETQNTLVPEENGSDDIDPNSKEPVNFQGVISFLKNVQLKQASNSSNTSQSKGMKTRPSSGVRSQTPDSTTSPSPTAAEDSTNPGRMSSAENHTIDTSAESESANDQDVAVEKGSASPQNSLTRERRTSPQRFSVAETRSASAEDGRKAPAALSEEKVPDKEPTAERAHSVPKKRGRPLREAETGATTTTVTVNDHPADASKGLANHKNKTSSDDKYTGVKPKQTSTRAEHIQENSFSGQPETEMNAASSSGISICPAISVLATIAATANPVPVAAHPSGLSENHVDLTTTSILVSQGMSLPDPIYRSTLSFSTINTSTTSVSSKTSTTASAASESKPSSASIDTPLTSSSRTQSPGKTARNSSKSPRRLSPRRGQENIAVHSLDGAASSESRIKNPYVSLTKIKGAALKELCAGKTVNISLDTSFEQSPHKCFLPTDAHRSLQQGCLDSSQENEDDNYSDTGDMGISDSDRTFLYGDEEDLSDFVESPSPTRESWSSPKRASQPDQLERNPSLHSCRTRSPHKNAEQSPSKKNRSSSGPETTCTPRESTESAGPRQPVTGSKEMNTEYRPVRKRLYLVSGPQTNPFAETGNLTVSAGTSASNREASEKHPGEIRSDKQRRLTKQRKPRVSAEKSMVTYPQAEVDLQELFSPGHKLRKRSAVESSDKEDDSRDLNSKSRKRAELVVAADVHGCPLRGELYDENSFNVSDLPVTFANQKGSGRDSSSMPLFVTSFDCEFNGVPRSSTPTQGIFDDALEIVDLPRINSPRRRRQQEKEMERRRQQSSEQHKEKDSEHHLEESPHTEPSATVTNETHQNRSSGVSGGLHSQENVSHPAITPSRIVIESTADMRAFRMFSARDSHKMPLNINSASHNITNTVTKTVELPVRSMTNSNMNNRSRKQQSKFSKVAKMHKSQRKQTSAVPNRASGSPSLVRIFTPSIAESVKFAESRRKQAAQPTPDLETTASHMAKSLAVNGLYESGSSTTNCQLHTSEKDSKKSSNPKVGSEPANSCYSDTTNASSSDRNYGKALQYVCKKCGAKFKKRANYLLHKKNHGKDRFACDICGNTFSRKESVKTHKMIHTGEAAVDCKVCGRTLSTQASLLTHMRIHTDEKPYECSLCSRTFRQKSALRSHYRIHTQDRPFKCNLCSKAYRFQKNLYNHKFTHTGERRHVCHICNASFYQTSALKVHMKVHTGERPFPCQKCNMRFMQKAHLAKHMRYIHMDKVLAMAAREAKYGNSPFRCGSCGKGFTSLYSKRRHARHFCVATLTPPQEEQTMTS